MASDETGRPADAIDRNEVLDLFCGLGGFSAAFEDSDRWEVTTVDVEERYDPDICADVFDLKPSTFMGREFDLVLASPPCTEFSTMQNMNGGVEPSGDAVALVHHTIGLIEGLSPDYWFLENPRGRLRTYIGAPEATVTYCQYGEEHMKPTDLWGEHPPMTYRACNYGDSCHLQNRGGNHAMRDVAGKKTRSERAKVPYGLSDAIREAVEEAIENPPPRQATLVSDGGERNRLPIGTDMDCSTEANR